MATTSANAVASLLAQARHDAENDWSDDWQQPQKSEEGRGWADINKGGRRRA